MTNKRIEQKFAQVKAEDRAALVTYIMGGDPHVNDSQKLFEALPSFGADIIELGMPFTDPVADGEVIQMAGQRALAAGVDVNAILSMVETFRKTDALTPIILMGYYNPIYRYGVDGFLKAAHKAGVDGLIIVDLPIEEYKELQEPAQQAGIDFISLITPATPDERIAEINQKASGFLYYVSITGVTGTSSATEGELKDAIFRIKQNSQLPVAIGFGINNALKAKQAGKIGDAVVVGSSIVKYMAQDNKDFETTLSDIKEHVSSLALALKTD